MSIKQIRPVTTVAGEIVNLMVRETNMSREDAGRLLLELSDSITLERIAVEEGNAGIAAFDNSAEAERDYLALQSVADIVCGALNRNGAANLTVCPRCRIDDFTHVEGCPLIPADEP